jgi:hypothetical protein
LLEEREDKQSVSVKFDPSAGSTANKQTKDSNF